MPASCKTCGGKRWVVYFQTREDCPECVVPKKDDGPCPSCGGAGLVQVDYGGMYYTVECWICGDDDAGAVPVGYPYP